MKNIAVLTSGGDAPGMNAAIRAVVRTSIYNDVNIFGITEGYAGLLEGKIQEMDLSSVADIIHRGGTMLRSSRSEEFETEEGFNKALKIIEEFNIDGIIVLGGDGSLRGARQLSKAGVPTIGIPCTIDNDLGYTDYSIGFYTALETVVEAIGRIRDTSTSHGRANIIEVMGRNCGDIALYGGLAGGAESIIVPEMDLDLDEVIEKAVSGRNRGKLHHIIVLAEGIIDAYKVAKEVEEGTGIDTRVTILGYTQRGGTPITFDRILASNMGRKAVELLLNNETNKALGIRCNEIINIPIERALEIKKDFDKDMFETAQMLSI